MIWWKHFLIWVIFSSSFWFGVRLAVRYRHSFFENVNKILTYRQEINTNKAPKNRPIWAGIKYIIKYKKVLLGELKCEVCHYFAKVYILIQIEKNIATFQNISTKKGLDEFACFFTSIAMSVLVLFGVQSQPILTKIRKNIGRAESNHTVCFSSSESHMSF